MISIFYECKSQTGWQNGDKLWNIWGIRKSISLNLVVGSAKEQGRLGPSWEMVCSDVCQPFESGHMEHLICQICQNNMLLNDERGNKICKEDIPNLKQIQSQSEVLWSPITGYKLLWSPEFKVWRGKDLSNRKWSVLFILVLQRGPSLLRPLAQVLSMHF